MFRPSPYANLSADQWGEASEDEKTETYNKCLRRAQKYIDEAFKGNRKREWALLNAALEEIETALEIYPKDFKAQNMKNLIEKHMGFAAIAGKDAQ